MPIEVEMPRASRSLTVTLAVAFLSLSVAVLLIASSLQIFFNFQTQRVIVASKQQLIAREAANTVTSFILEKFSVLEAAVRLGIPTHAAPQEQKQVLDSLLGLEPAFRQVVLLDVQGQELVKTSRLSQMASGQLTDRIKSDLLAQTSQGSKYVGSVYIDDITSEPLVIMAVPVTNVFGDFQGTLIAEANLKFMWDLVDRLEVGETGLAYVVDRRGNLIAFGDISRVLRGENVSNLTEVSEFINNPAPIDETGAGSFKGITGATVIGTYVPLGTPDWAVVIELPVSEAYREVIRGGAISLAVLLAVGILAGLIGAYMARRLAAPLLGLTATATRIAGGEMGLRATPDGPTEVVSLAQAFNSMTSQLQELIGSLEQQVSERTHQWQETNYKLQRRAIQLEAVTLVGRAVTSILNLDDLLLEVVNLIRARFDFYHAGIFLIDENGAWAVLRQATGEAGQRMLARKHRLAVGGQSIVGWAAANRQPRIAHDVGEDAVHFKNPDLPHTRSEMALPLMVGNRLLGALDVQSTEESAFDDEDVTILSLMADQVAVAIENALKFSQEAAILEATSPLYRASHRIALATSLDDVLDSVVDNAAGPFVDCCGIYLYTPGTEDDEIGWIEVAALWDRAGDPPHPPGTRYPVDEGSDLFESLRQETAEQLVVTDLLAGEIDKRIDPSAHQLLTEELQLRSVLMLPLVAAGQTMGLLVVASRQPHTWTEAELRIFRSLSDQTAIAVENVRLLGETQARAGREQVVRQITERMWHAVDVESILQATVTGLGQAMGVPRVYARLDPEASSRGSAPGVES
jgi:GAF domain-containing protein/HAMP domain-containing protein